MKRRGGLGWIPAMGASGLMTQEEHFWSKLPLDGMVVYDIGAFQGLLTLYFATRAKSVVSFEPNSSNHQRLLDNIHLNRLSNVKVRKVGIGARCEVRNMVAASLVPGGASVDKNIVEQTLQQNRITLSEEVAVVPVDVEIDKANLPPPDLIKLDIEGHELPALKGARRTLRKYKPLIFLEMHGETVESKRQRAERIVTFLWELNYREIIHIESGISITLENCASAMEGHIFCRSC